MTGGLRAPRHEDAPAVAELISRDAPEPVDAARVLGEWTFPGFSSSTDARVGEGSYAFVDGFGDGRVWIDVAGRLYPQLLDWAEDRAPQLGSRLLSGGWTTQRALLAELERRGFGLARTSFRMAIDLDEPTPDAGLARRCRGHGPFDPATSGPSTSSTRRRSPTRGSRSRRPTRSGLTSSSAPRRSLPSCGRSPSRMTSRSVFAICHPHAVEPELGWVRILGVAPSFRGRGLGRALLLRAFAQFRSRGMKRVGLGVDGESPTGANALYESAGMRVVARFEIREKRRRDERSARPLSELPDVHRGCDRATGTSATGAEGRSPPASSVSLRLGARGRGHGGWRAHPAAVSGGRGRRARRSRRAERRGRRALAARPIAVGGCCCTHVGAAMGVARRVDRLGLVWIDAHGDLNTPETSPSGNRWGMPFRMLLDAGIVAAEDAALVGARSLDPPETEFMADSGIDDSLERALAGVDAVYVALDLDVLDPAEVDVLIPEPDGLSADELEALLRDLAGRRDDRRYRRDRLSRHRSQRRARGPDARGGRFLGRH